MRADLVGNRQSLRWKDAHPEAVAELKRAYAVLVHSAVLMLLSLSLIGTALTVPFLELAEWGEQVVRDTASLASLVCSAIALWRLVRAVWRAVRAVGAAGRGAAKNR
ncbi:hypothetical protein OG800_49710 (plasmid) [Streptomyces sp. NBC_00445]|uniref:hypothetical protein n=1 Tax=Streptomyces sp. NBC_00445 TaxID=2975745 RepID=UPI002E1F2251